jgi:ankyrin repeat protein
MARKSLWSTAPSQDKTVVERVSSMIQPEILKTDEYDSHNGGTGNDIWAMISAAGTGDTRCLKRLLKRNSELVRCQFSYRAPLHFAVRENQREAVEVLLKAGAAPWFRSGSKSHETPIQIAHDREFKDIHAMLTDYMARVYQSTPDGSLLEEAVKAKDFDRVTALLDSNPALITETDELGNPALFAAVAANAFAMVDLLLNRGADLRSRNARGAGMLDLASEVMIGYLLARGAEIDIRCASRIGDFDEACRLLDADLDLAKEITPHLLSPLKLAAEGRHTSIVRLLLERGADPNAPEHGAGRGGALHMASARGHFEIAKILLEHGADPNAYVESSGDCLLIAKDRKQSHMIPLLASYGAGSSVYMYLFTEEIEPIAAMFRVDPSLANNLTAFDQAARSGLRDIVRLFLMYEPDLIKQVSTWGKTAEFTRWLLDQGMPTSLAQHDLFGITQLHLMAAENQIDRASLFLEFGADPYVRDQEYGSTSLAWAARCGHDEMVSFLIETGVKTSLPEDPPWATPLAWAEKRGHQEIAEVLRRNGAIA